MRAVGTRVTFIHGLTHRVDYETSPLPPWLVKQRFTESQTQCQREEACSLWHTRMYLVGNHVTLLFYPGGLEDEIIRMHEVVGGVL